MIMITNRPIMNSSWFRPPKRPQTPPAEDWFADTGACWSPFRSVRVVLSVLARCKSFVSSTERMRAKNNPQTCWECAEFPCDATLGETNHFLRFGKLYLYDGNRGRT